MRAKQKRCALIIPSAVIFIAIMFLPCSAFTQHTFEKPQVVFVPEYQTVNPGNVFVGTGRVYLKIRLLDIVPGKDAYQGTFSIKDYFGKTIHINREAPFSKNKEAYICEISLDIKETGWYWVDVDIYQNNKKVTSVNPAIAPSVSSFTFAVLPGARAVNNFFGVNIPRKLDHAQAYLIKQAGAGWVKFDALWEEMQRDEESIDWSLLDESVNAARAHDLNILLSIDYSPLCFSTAPPSVKEHPDFRERLTATWYEPQFEPYEKFLRSLVIRYKDSIKYFEVWNEPDFIFWKTEKERYADFLARSSRIIKELNPGALVLMGGSSQVKEEWVDEFLFKKGAINSFDIYNVHPYHFFLKGQLKRERKADYLGEYYSWLYPRLKEYMHFTAGKLKSPKPVWITEIGMPVGTFPFGPESREPDTYSFQDQAESFVRDGAGALAAGIERFFINVSKDIQIDSRNSDMNWGIFFPDLAPKASFVAYAVMAGLLKDAEYDSKVAEELTLNERSVYGYPFKYKGSSTQLFVLWTSLLREQFSLTTGKKKITIVDIMGKDINLVSKGGVVEIPLTQSPVYVLLSD